MNLSLRRRDPPQTQRRIRALTAASQSGNPERNGRADASGRLQKLSQDWQLRALDTYDTVGELWYPSQFYARSLAKTRYFPALLNEKGEAEEQKSGELVDLFERIRDPDSSGRSDLAASYGRLQFLNGDGYLVVSEDDEGNEAWEYLSVKEIRIDPDERPGDPQRYKRHRAPGGIPEELSEAPDTAFGDLKGSDVRVWRLWRPHPAHSLLADAPVRAVLDLYELLHRLTLAAGAEASSRAAQRGMLFVAEEIADRFKVTGVDDDPEADAFLVALEEALTNAIQNPGTAGALSPIVLRGPAGISDGAGGKIALKDCIGWLPLGPSDRYTEGEMWEKTINRIGNGLDLPVEILTGMGQANHWSGWLLDETGYRQHVAPVTQRFCDDLASCYLRPAAEDAGFAEWERVAVGYDSAEAIQHPDQVNTAGEAHDRLAISDAAYRAKTNFTEKDAPDEAEYARRALILLHRVPKEIAADEPVGETAPQDGGSGGDTVEQPPAQPVTNGNGANGNGQAAVTAAALQTAKILGWAEFALDRAHELAGNRLVRRSKSCVECIEKIKAVPVPRIASTLGQETVRGIIDGHITEAALVQGVQQQMVKKLREWGMTGDWPEQLGQLVEQHALRTLYDDKPAPLPPGFTAVVAKALR